MSAAIEPIQIVWFKRDLRSTDHAPLAEAAARGPVLPLSIAEPSLLTAEDADPRHWTFVQASLRELRAALASLGQPLIVRTGEAIDVFEALLAERPIAAIWAHEETGTWLSYQRDRAVRRWARARGIHFHELPNDGVIRRLPTRDAWVARWESRMRAPQIATPARLEPVPDIDPGPIPSHADLGLAADGCTGAQPGGMAAARQTLTSFLEQRGEPYAGAMSSPVSAWEGCSRLSPHLTWGTLSMREVTQASRAKVAEVRALPPAERGSWLKSLSAFEARLHWRDHFIQKLEDEPEIEFSNFVRAYDGLREGHFNPDRYDAWAAGQTGYPLIDACMRALHQTGWINFRMRAMLVSFASYDLWLHWREPGVHLARMFVDFEPGIHWSQHQMQAGTTGINTIRIYNPTKQAKDQDPEGTFIRAWVPELAGVPTSFIHTPWLMPIEMQMASGCVIGRNYPSPIVDHAEASREAQRLMYAARKTGDAREQAAAVQQKHGSRKKPSRPPGPPRGRRRQAIDGQIPLDLG